MATLYFLVAIVSFVIALPAGWLHINYDKNIDERNKPDCFFGWFWMALVGSVAWIIIGPILLSFYVQKEYFWKEKNAKSDTEKPNTTR
jgi:hypothetical protein